MNNLLKNKLLSMKLQGSVFRIAKGLIFFGSFDYIAACLMNNTELRMDFTPIVEENKRMAKALLEEQAGEFYPFAYAQKDATIKNITAWSGDDFPLTETVIADLENALQDVVRSDGYDTVSICIDIRYIPEGANTKTDALNIKINSQYAEPFEIVVPYHIQNDTVLFGEMEKWTGEAFIYF